MKVNDKANVTRQQLLDWLADPKDHTLFMQKGTSSAVIVKIPKDSEVEYLFGAGESDGSVVRQEGYLSFCGLFAKGSQSLFVARAPLCTWVEGLTEVERMSRAEIAVHIAQEVNRTVEALIGNDRERLQVKEITNPELLHRLQYYQETGAARDAVKRFVRSKDTPRRFRSQYPICSLSEAEFLAYVRTPTVYVQDKAEQYIQDNQEAFLLQFLCNDAYQEAYAAIARDVSHPAQRMRAITDALERCGGKTVAVTVRRGNAEMTFKTPVKSLLGYHDFYDLCEASMEDYHTFSRMFGDVTCSYQAEDIVCITYGKRTIYEAPDLSPAPMERTMTMSGMREEAAMDRKNTERNIVIRPASREEAGLFYSDEKQDELLGTVGHLRMDFGSSGKGFYYCCDLRQQELARQSRLVGRVTFASGEKQEFTDAGQYLQTIQEELPYRNTTGFRFETLTDDPQVRKAVDDILLDFAGEENPCRACNYGLTEAGRQALRDTADPNLPHTYAWFVMTDCGAPEEQIHRNLTLEEAIQLYQDSDRVEKRLGVTKDGIATVDLVCSMDGEQQFFDDYRKIDSFRDDPVVTEAAETLGQELAGPVADITMGGL